MVIQIIKSTKKAMQFIAVEQPLCRTRSNSNYKKTQTETIQIDGCHANEISRLVSLLEWFHWELAVAAMKVKMGEFGH